MDAAIWLSSGALGLWGEVPPTAAAIRLSSGPVDALGVVPAIDAAIWASSGLTAGRDPTTAATLLSSGPPSERRLGVAWTLTGVAFCEESLPSARVRTMAAPAASASSAPSQTVRLGRISGWREILG